MICGAMAEVLVVVVMIYVPFINAIFYTEPLPFVYFAWPFLAGIGLVSPTPNSNSNSNPQLQPQP